MKRIFKQEPDYYWGLILLFVSCFSLVWALWRDAFKPPVFLTGLLVFSLGYALLWRYDIKQKLASLAAEITDLKSQLPSMHEPVSPPTWSRELSESGETAETVADTSELTDSFITADAPDGASRIDSAVHAAQPETPEERDTTVLTEF